MKRIFYFEIIDFGIKEIETSKLYIEMESGILSGCAVGMGTDAESALSGIFNGCAVGMGTDAESALDDLLNTLQEEDYDVSGLEGQIKDEWNPSFEEGDNFSTYYHFGIVFKFV